MAGIPHDQVHPDTLAAIAEDILGDETLDDWIKRHLIIMQVPVPQRNQDAKQK